MIDWTKPLKTADGRDVEYRGELLLETGALHLCVVSDGAGFHCIEIVDKNGQPMPIDPRILEIQAVRNPLGTVETWTNYYPGGLYQQWETEADAVLHRRDECIATIHHVVDLEAIAGQFDDGGRPGDA